MTSACVVLTGGGSGGHIFPLLAVADALSDVVGDLKPVFVGTSRGLEKRLVPPSGIPLELLPSVPFRGGGVWGASRGLLGVLRCLPRALQLLRRHRPKVVLSSGGYSSVPIALAARLLGIPLALIEPNGAPGLANRLSGPMAKRIYTVFEDTGTHFRRLQVQRLGHALRAGFDRTPYEVQKASGGQRRLLVLGGSQGASSLNETVPQALKKVSVVLNVVHQVGRGHLEEAGRNYATVRNHSVELVEFIEDMPKALRDADLILSRAGTGHIAEACAVGRPSILVPLATTGVGQLQNAQAVEAAGAALCLPSVDATAGRVADALEELLTDPGRLEAMAKSAADWGRPKAALAIAKDLARLGDLPTSEAIQKESQR